MESKELGTLGVYFEAEAAQKKIKELKEQLEEKELEAIRWEEHFNNAKMDYQCLKEDKNKEIANLEKQLAEKGKEIKELKANQTATNKELSPLDYDNYNLADKLRYKESQVYIAMKRLVQLPEIDKQTIRHQVCEEIRGRALDLYYFTPSEVLEHFGENYYLLAQDDLETILDQIEGEK